MGVPIEITEVKQEQEPDVLKNYFKKPIEYIQPKKLNLQVGHRNEDRPMRLFRIGGKKNYFVVQVECAATSLNQRWDRRNIDLMGAVMFLFWTMKLRFINGREKKRIE